MIIVIMVSFLVIGIGTETFLIHLNLLGYIKEVRIEIL